MRSSYTAQLRNSLFVLAAGAALVSLFSGGCPQNPAPGGNGAGGVLLTDLAFGPEGLTPDQVETAAAASSDIPQDLSGVEFLGGLVVGLPAGPDTAKGRAADSNPACVDGDLAAILKFHADMIQRAQALDAIRNLPGDPPNGYPDQPNGLAYVRGGKRWDVRTRPSHIDCEGDGTEFETKCTTPLFGMDCSGFVRECAVSAGANLKAEPSAAELNTVELWNAQGVLPEGWGVQMVRIEGAPRRWLTGDIAIFGNGSFSHTGIVVVANGVASVWNSLGSGCNDCAKNMLMGPSQFPVTDTVTMNKLHFQGVLRLVPKCAVSDLVAGEDSMERLQARAAVIEQQVTFAAQALFNSLLRCDGTPREGRQACLEAAYQQFLNEICAQANQMTCITFRALMLSQNAADVGALRDFVEQGRFLTSLPGPDGRVCPCQINAVWGS